MGSALSHIENRQRQAALDARLADVKQAKRLRDLQVATQIASTRDRLLWVAGYYSTMLAMSLVRHVALHRRGVSFHFDNFFLPLNVAIICAPPWLVGYQLDLALPESVVPGLPLGGKATRLQEETLRIRDGLRHRWFDHPWLPEVDDAQLAMHRPVRLPATLAASYAREREATNSARAARGLQPEPEWGTFEE
eukprot:TRINITY_DN55249_c0_g1_i1.p2 TRINITY_DN55249_c0_g1~~TRINITY_DN55249_c0_g1_i1.p2  ORF type:complete len:212 (+),score=39.33 TRINITY_DN55249_c0_g1_i1:58-636(+)